MKQVCPHTFISRKGSVLLNIFHKSFERLFTSMPASKIATARKCLLNKLSDSKALRISAPRRPFFSIDIAQNLAQRFADLSPRASRVEKQLISFILQFEILFLAYIPKRIAA